MHTFAVPTREDQTAPRGAPGESREGLAHKLVVFSRGERAVHELPARGMVHIGRASGSDVVIQHPSVSRRHARLYLGDSLRVEDLQSWNGTRVGGALVPPGAAVVVAPLQMIELGDTLAVVGNPALLSERAGARALVAAQALEDPMARLMRLVEAVAKSGADVLVLGETGVGKGQLAEVIHKKSSRADRRFARINCASMPELMLESELFGHERGAFPGALATKPGLFETVEGGTVFLDEVADLPPGTQAKLLGVLERREVFRLGGLEPRRVSARVICATHRPLEALTAADRFRQDLYFRLNGISMVVPPLRTRASEIPALAAGFAEQAAARLGRRAPRVSEELAGLLVSYAWPGNIRELKNVIEGAVLLCADDTLGPEHLVCTVSATPAPASGPRLVSERLDLASIPDPVGRRCLREEIEVLERTRIVHALDACGGNQTKAAKLVGIPLRTFVKRLEAYDVPRPRKART
jgi:two-component system, NtrC family, response regulator AtoC